MNEPEIKILHLNTAETVIAKVSLGLDGSYIVKEYLLLYLDMQRQSQPGVPALVVMPWMPFADASVGITIPSSAVTAVMTPREDILTQYKQVTSSIQLASSVPDNVAQLNRFRG